MAPSHPKPVSAVVPAPAKAEHPPAVTRVLSLVQATAEGGQMPLQRRLPKFGFKNMNRVEYKAINLNQIDALAQAKALEKVGLDELRAAGFISRNQLVKVLANGTLSRAIAVEANAFSAAAEKAIVEAGGSISKI